MYSNADFFEDDYVSKKEKRQSRKQKRNQRVAVAKPVIRVKPILPLTKNQERTFEAFEEGKHLLLHGSAGTGKTFIALGLALGAVSDGDAPKPIIILRSVVPTRDMGFLPGKLSEKIAVYEEPYRGICNELTGHATGYDYLKKNNFVQFSTTSYLRGLTFRDNIVIVDEVQNLGWGELSTVITRMGEGCRVIFCGDFRQSDLIRNSDKDGLKHFMSILKLTGEFSSIEFTSADIVRSGLVKKFIMAQENYENKHNISLS